MKKLLIVFTSCFLSLVVLSQNVMPECPAGTHRVFVNNCGPLRFHRPIYNCEHGFFICSEGGCSGWHYECWPNQQYLQESNPVASISNGQAMIWGIIKDKKFEIHFPLALTTTPGYTSQDLSTFSVDSDHPFFSNGSIQYIMKQGQYSVATIGNELVVLVDLK